MIKKEMKTITVEKDTWKEISEIKLNKNFSSIDATIKALLNNTRRLENILKEDLRK